MIYLPNVLKRCTKCGLLKPFDEFPNDKSRPNGLFPRCKLCNAKNAQNHYRKDLEKSRAKERDRARTLRKERPEYRRAILARYETAHKEELDKKDREYRRRDNVRARRRQQMRDARAANPELHRQKKRNWRRANPEMARAEKQRRNARRLSLPAEFSATDWRIALNYWGHCCAYCGRQTVRLTQDHFVPLTSAQCPGTVPQNIIPACKSCNSAKKDRDPVEWLIGKVGQEQAEMVLQRIEVYKESLKHQ